MKWWYSFIRKKTKRIPSEQAFFWKQRLSLAYAFLAWNAFGFVMYSVYQGKSDWAHYHGLKSDDEHSMSPGHAWANTLGIKNAKVYRIAGLRKVDEYDIVDGNEVRTTNTQEKNPRENLE